MNNTLHITSGDSAGGLLSEAGLPGDVFVWHDVLYDGPRNPGWPTDETLAARAAWLEEGTDGGLDARLVQGTLRNQYEKLGEAYQYGRTVLWFDACLFDVAMLAHVLACLNHVGNRDIELLCVDSFPGIEPYNGLGQLTPPQLASVFDRRQPVTEEQFRYSIEVDRAFATQSADLLVELSRQTDAPLPWIPAAAARWLDERPDPKTGLGKLEALAMQAIADGCRSPAEIFRHVAAADITPQYWGDTTLWAKINGLARRNPPLALVEGPQPHLPQWISDVRLDLFAITPTDEWQKLHSA